MGIKAVFFDLDDTLYSSFQACDAYAYERMAAWVEEHTGASGAEFARQFNPGRSADD